MKIVFAVNTKIIIYKELTHVYQLLYIFIGAISRAKILLL